MITLTVTLTQTFNLLNKLCSHYIWQGKLDVDAQAESMSLSQDKIHFHLKVFLLSVLGLLFYPFSLFSPSFPSPWCEWFKNKHVSCMYVSVQMCVEAWGMRQVPSFVTLFHVFEAVSLPELGARVLSIGWQPKSPSLLMDFGIWARLHNSADIGCFHWDIFSAPRYIVFKFLFPSPFLT